jgi:hypothetical protein
MRLAIGKPALVPLAIVTVDGEPGVDAARERLGRATIEPVARLDCGRVVDARRLKRRSVVDAVARLRWRRMIGARWLLECGVAVDAVARWRGGMAVDARRLRSGGTVIGAPLLRNRRAVIEVIALVRLPGGGTRIGTVLLDRGRLCGRWRGARLGPAGRGAMIAPVARRITVAVIVVGERGRRERSEAQHCQKNCRCRASRHDRRDCARMVATA